MVLPRGGGEQHGGYQHGGAEQHLVQADRGQHYAASLPRRSLPCRPSRVGYVRLVRIAAVCADEPEPTTGAGGRARHHEGPPPRNAAVARALWPLAAGGLLAWEAPSLALAGQGKLFLTEFRHDPAYRRPLRCVR